MVQKSIPESDHRGQQNAPVVSDLAALKAAADAAHAAFTGTVDRLFPGATEWHWLRAVSHIGGEAVRRNDDTSKDTALAASAEIRAAWDAYLGALHAYYSLRDGPNGFLGGREKVNSVAENRS